MTERQERLEAIEEEVAGLGLALGSVESNDMSPKEVTTVVRDRNRLKALRSEALGLRCSRVLRERIDAQLALTADLLGLGTGA